MRHEGLQIGLDNALNGKRHHNLGSLHLRVSGVATAFGVVAELAGRQAHEELILGGVLAQLGKEVLGGLVEVDKRHTQLRRQLAHGNGIVAQGLLEAVAVDVPEGARDGGDKNGSSTGGARVVNVNGEVVLEGGEGVCVAGRVGLLVIVAELDEDEVAYREVGGPGLLPPLLVVEGLGAAPQEGQAAYRHGAEIKKGLEKHGPIGEREEAR
ncbi:hypothetical protein L7F22_021572 [Adiantum nelumboides]|nr:hypothetical protein [Adiantum nelumboides]